MGDRRSGHWPAHVVLVGVQILFATFPVAAKDAMGEGGYAPMAVAAWRVIAGGASLLFLARIMYPGAWWLGRALPHAFLLSLFGVTLNQMLFIEGVARSSVVTTGFMMAVIPVATYGLSVLFRQERYTGVKIAGLVTGTAGMACLILIGAQDESREDTVLGNLLLLGNSVSYSIFLVLARPLLQKTASLVVTAWTFVLAIPIVVPIAWSTSWTAAGANEEATWALLWILAVPTVLNYFLVSWALSRLPASIIASYIYLQPVVAAVLGVLWRGEKVAPDQAIGGVLILAGIYLVSRKPRSAQEPAGASESAT